jgi:hypothetical protein
MHWPSTVSDNTCHYKTALYVVRVRKLLAEPSNYILYCVTLSLIMCDISCIFDRAASDSNTVFNGSTVTMISEK